ncbi:MAG: PTS sugar transporter subunit IIC [Lachnospiraceae bacterium]|jgi:PTS system cellobiose-specific IIC component|nr:PTS sugar transporter subunit IIC [Lachnospiraceae bacterium]
MKELFAKVEKSLTKFSDIFAKSIVLNIISSAFMMIMPITIVGSIASLIRGIDMGGYQAWLQSSGLYNLVGAVYQFSIGLLALYIVFCIGYQYAQKSGMKKQSLTIGLTSIFAFLVITPYTPAESAYGAATLSTTWLSSSGMFMAMVVGFVVGYIYKFSITRHLEIKLPEQVPPTIARQFSALIPSFIIAVLFVLINWIFSMTSMGNAQDALYAVVKIPLSAVSASIWGLLILNIFVYLLWFFGIHGGMAIMPISMLLFTSLQLENLAAYQAGLPLPNWITGSYIAIGSGSFPLVVAMLIWGKSKANRSISKLAVVPALFGVDEPAYFGVPMIMNPIFFLPWVILVPTLLTLGTYLLQAIGLVGYHTGASAGGFVPFFVTNMVGYGIPGLIWGAVFFILAVFIYLPFVKIYDKQCLAKENGQPDKEE